MITGMIKGIIIRKILVSAISLILICLVFTACQKGKPKEENTPVTAPAAESLSDIIYNGNFSTTDGPEVKGQEWVKMWLNHTYADRQISDIAIEYLTGAVYSELSDQYKLYPLLYNVSFSSPKGTHDLKLMVVTVAENDNTKAVLSGFLGPDEFNEYDAVKQVYNVVAKDPRYKDRLKALPEVNLPAEFTPIDMKEICGDHNNYSSLILPDGIIAAITMDDGDNDDYNVGVAFYDIKKRQSSGFIDIGNFSTFYSKESQGKLQINAVKDNSPNMEIITIDSQKNISAEKFSPEKNYVLYSPDKSKYAFSNNGSLYVAGVSDEPKTEPKLLIEGNNSDGEDRNYYYPFAWEDNVSLTYGIGGYEWSNGCGTVNTATDKNVFFEQAAPNSTPQALINGKLYTSEGEMGAQFDPGVIDLNDPQYPFHKVFRDKEVINNLFIESFAFSPDGTQLALLKKAANFYEKNTLFLCSTTDGSIIKSFKFSTAFGLPRYLHYVDNEQIVIFSERYAFCAKYMYVVDLR